MLWRAYAERGDQFARHGRVISAMEKPKAHGIKAASVTVVGEAGVERGRRVELNEKRCSRRESVDVGTGTHTGTGSVRRRRKVVGAVGKQTAATHNSLVVPTDECEADGGSTIVRVGVGVGAVIQEAADGRARVRDVEDLQRTATHVAKRHRDRLTIDPYTWCRLRGV